MIGATTSRLRTISGLRLPTLILAMLCGGFVFNAALTSVFAEEPVEYPSLSVLVSPASVGFALLAATACSALFVAGMRADRRLAQQRFDRREDLMRRLAGEESIRRWTSSEPVLCNRVEELRRRRGVAPEQLAIVLGLSVRSLIRIEKGTYAPSIPLAVMIAEFFELPLSDVFRLETPHPRSCTRKRP